MTEPLVENLFANCDGWHAKEWFERLVRAIESRNKAVVSGDEISFKTHNNIASSSASRLAMEFRDEMLAALAAADALTAGEREPVEGWLYQFDDEPLIYFSDRKYWADNNPRWKETAVYTSPPASELEALRKEIERLTKLLTGRDNFIVNQGLWSDFVATLPAVFAMEGKQMVDAPEKLWLSAADIDSDHLVWFDPDEGGTEYIRADLYATLEAEVSRLTDLVDEAKVVAKPFADTADHDIGDDETDEDIFHPMTNHNSAMKITVGHMRAARAFAEKAGA